MSDTVRTPAQNYALAANNTSQDYSPQDLRDFMRSMWGCYGGMTTFSGAQTFMLTSTYQTILPWVGALPTLDLTVSASAGTITIPAGGNYDGVYEVSFDITLQRTVGADSPFLVKLLNNALELLTHATSISADGQWGNVGGRTFVSLVAGDVLNLQFANLVGSTATFLSGNFMARRVA